MCVNDNEVYQNHIQKVELIIHDAFYINFLIFNQADFLYSFIPSFVSIFNVRSLSKLLM